jgi:hypothetical protein
MRGRGAHQHRNGIRRLAEALQRQRPAVEIIGAERVARIRIAKKRDGIGPALLRGCASRRCERISVGLCWCVIRLVGLEAEAIAIARKVAHGVRDAALAQHAAQRAYGALQRVVGDGDAGPERVEQFVLRYDAGPVLDQVDQEIKDARLQRHLAPGQQKHAARFVESKRVEVEGHL